MMLSLLIVHTQIYVYTLPHFNNVQNDEEEKIILNKNDQSFNKNPCYIRTQYVYSIAITKKKIHS